MILNKSVILSCAGIGSRLGLNKNKSLVEILGKPIIQWQLENFREIDDLRIVLGYQAEELKKQILKLRKNVTFIYNQNYLQTKTGASFYLGAKDAKNKYVIEWDGDLFVHPDDVKNCLESTEEYIAYSDISSKESVFVKTDQYGNVLKFSKIIGNFEWTGPACIQKNKIEYTAENVFNQLEKYLPMKGLKIRAKDIDTPEDYQKTIKFIKSWT